MPVDKLPPDSTLKDSSMSHSNGDPFEAWFPAWLGSIDISMKKAYTGIHRVVPSLSKTLACEYSGSATHRGGARANAPKTQRR
jgi:hypothetical protein